MRDQKPNILSLSFLFCLICGCGSGSDPVGNQITIASLDIVADGMLAIPENSTFVTDIEVLTSASQPASLQISGVDSSLFQLNKRSLFFKDSPDYENPSSHDRDNSYEITVSATVDDVSAEKDLLITVLDRNELNLGPYLPLSNSEFDYENYERLASDLIIEELHSEHSKFWGARFLDDNHFLATRQDGFFILYDLVDYQVHRFEVKESIDLSVRGQEGYSILTSCGETTALLMLHLQQPLITIMKPQAWGSTSLMYRLARDIQLVLLGNFSRPMPTR